MAKQQHAKDLNGMSIYRDKKNRVIYSNFLMGKSGYMITDMDIVAFNRYRTRLPLAACILVLAYFVLEINLYISAGIAAIVYIVMALLFYFKFLPSLNKTENFEKSKPSIVDQIVEKMSMTKILISICLSLVLTVLSALNANNYEELLNKGLNYIVSLFALAYLLFLIAAAIKKKKQK